MNSSEIFLNKLLEESVQKLLSLEDIPDKFLEKNMEEYLEYPEVISRGISNIKRRMRKD